MSEQEPTNKELHVEIRELRKELRADINSVSNNLNDLIDFMREHVATKEDLKDLEFRFDRKLGKLDHGLRDYVDRKIGGLRGDLVQVGAL